MGDCGPLDAYMKKKKKSSDGYAGSAKSEKGDVFAGAKDKPKKGKKIVGKEAAQMAEKPKKKERKYLDV